MTPKARSFPCSTRLMGAVSKYSLSFRSRSSTATWRGRACAGIITFFAGVSLKPRAGASCRAPSATGPPPPRARVGADVGLRHEGVRRHVQADVLHGRERALAREGSADGDVQG